jgi:uncharacterized membrane protein
MKQKYGYTLARNLVEGSLITFTTLEILLLFIPITPELRMAELAGGVTFVVSILYAALLILLNALYDQR